MFNYLSFGYAFQAVYIGIPEVQYTSLLHAPPPPCMQDFLKLNNELVLTLESEIHQHSYLLLYIQGQLWVQM